MSCAYTFDSSKEDSKIDYPKGKENLTDTLTTISLTDQQWKAKLDDSTYRVMRNKGTERAFTGEYDKNYKSGTYVCNSCQLPLFESDTKFDSGSGWPSFFNFINNHVEHISDSSHGWERTEVVCNRCKGHLGHVFTDGPKPTRLRYCINSISLDFLEK